MRFGGALWFCLLTLVCLILFAGGAIVRPFRVKYAAKAKLRAESRSPTTLPPTRTTWSRSRSSGGSSAMTVSRFHPTAQRCCQIGERAARKKKICDVTHLAVVRRYNYERRRMYSKNMNKKGRKRFTRKRLGRLSEKISKCSATFPKYFMKCCDYKQEYLRHLRKCRQKPYRQRKRCRQVIKRKYT